MRAITPAVESSPSVFSNILAFLAAVHELKNRYTYVRWKKQDIQEAKQDIKTQKQDIRIPESFSNKTKQHIQRLFSAFGYIRMVTSLI